MLDSLSSITKKSILVMIYSRPTVVCWEPKLATSVFGKERCESHSTFKERKRTFGVPNFGYNTLSLRSGG